MSAAIAFFVWLYWSGPLFQVIGFWALTLALAMGAMDISDVILDDDAWSRSQRSRRHQ